MIAALRPGTKAFPLLTHKGAFLIGRLSYSLYLWRWGALCVSRWTIGVEWWTLPLQIASMFGLAAVSYFYIESPLRHMNWSAPIAYPLML